MKVELRSTLLIDRVLLPETTQEEIKKEPMLHRADRLFALENGGPLTKHFLQALSWHIDIPILIDSRVHMLMPGMFPAIPGWHGDDVPRERADGQPNYINPSYKSDHCMAIWGDCSLTQFASGSFSMEIPPLGAKIYKVWNEQIDALCAKNEHSTTTVPERRMAYFDWMSWHRAMPATHRGFRFFIRATKGSNLSTRNEIFTCQF